MNETDKLAKILWDYHKLNHQISKADVIVCLGNNEIDRCLARTIDLFNNGLAPIIIFSGGVGPHSKSQVAEADILKEKALKLGIPAPTILVENKSMHTGENMVFTSKLLKDSKIKVSKIIFVTKGNMERRVFATFKKQWLNNKNIKVMVTSPKISYQSYPNKKVSKVTEFLSSGSMHSPLRLMKDMAFSILW